MRHLVLLASLAATPTTSVLAAEPLNFMTQLLDYRGEPLTQPKNDPAKCARQDVPFQPVQQDLACLRETIPLTLGDVSVNALLSQLDEDRNVTGVVKQARDKLARRVYGNVRITLSPEDVTLIKERVGKVYGAAVVGAAYPLLDGTPPGKSDEK